MVLFFPFYLCIGNNIHRYTHFNKKCYSTSLVSEYDGSWVWILNLGCNFDARLDCPSLVLDSGKVFHLTFFGPPLTSSWSWHEVLFEFKSLRVTFGIVITLSPFLLFIRLRTLGVSSCCHLSDRFHIKNLRIQFKPLRIKSSKEPSKIIKTTVPNRTMRKSKLSQIMDKSIIESLIKLCMMFSARYFELKWRPLTHNENKNLNLETEDLYLYLQMTRKGPKMNLVTRTQNDLFITVLDKVPISVPLLWVLYEVAKQVKFPWFKWDLVDQFQNRVPYFLIQLPRQLFFFGISKPWKFQIVSSLFFPLCNKNLNSFLTEVRKLFKGGKYSREETIWGNTVVNIISQKDFQICRSQISDLKMDNVDYLKKPSWKKFFFDIFAIHSSSRHEKRCQISVRLFSLFPGSIYQQWDCIQIFSNPH